MAKATIDTIRDRNIQDNNFSWNRGIKNVFGYKLEEVGNNATWWFNKIHPEDSIKMFIKLYSLIRQKTGK